MKDVLLHLIYLPYIFGWNLCNLRFSDGLMLFFDPYTDLLLLFLKILVSYRKKHMVNLKYVPTTFPLLAYKSSRELQCRICCVVNMLNLVLQTPNILQ